MLVRRAGFLSFLGAIAASCSSAGTPLPEPSPPDAGSASPLGTARPDVDGGPDADAGPVCQDDDGVTTTCEGVTDKTCLAECETALEVLKPRVARKQIECIRTQSKLNATCEGCRRLALESACPDESAGEVCDAIEAKCKGKVTRDRAECMQHAAGMTFGGRLRFFYCATESECLFWPATECP